MFWLNDFLGITLTPAAQSPFPSVSDVADVVVADLDFSGALKVGVAAVINVVVVLTSTLTAPSQSTSSPCCEHCKCCCCGCLLLLLFSLML